MSESQAKALGVYLASMFPTVNNSQAESWARSFLRYRDPEIVRAAIGHHATTSAQLDATKLTHLIVTGHHQKYGHPGTYKPGDPSDLQRSLALRKSVNELLGALDEDDLEILKADVVRQMRQRGAEWNGVADIYQRCNAKCSYPLRIEMYHLLCRNFGQEPNTTEIAGEAVSTETGEVLPALGDALADVPSHAHGKSFSQSEDESEIA